MTSWGEKNIGGGTCEEAPSESPAAQGGRPSERQWIGLDERSLARVSSQGRLTRLREAKILSARRTHAAAHLCVMMLDSVHRAGLIVEDRGGSVHETPANFKIVISEKAKKRPHQVGQAETCPLEREMMC